jgi:23S rRNA (adenine-N6)-dimethyltransferase
LYKKNKSFDYSVSQNFLTSKKTINRILNLSSIDKDDFVYEIGAGKGHITCELAKRCKSVKAIEIDKSLCIKAQQRSLHQNNVYIIHGDFLKSHLPASEYKIFSNIPFCITTKIIDKILSAPTMPSEAWLVMQKGAAKRFCGLPYETKGSLILKPFYDAKIVYHFQNSDFHPSPKSKCVLVHFILKDKPDIKRAHYNKYRKFIASCVKDNYYDFTRVFTKNQLRRAKKDAGIQSKQDGRILYIQWLCLFRSYLKWHS